MTLKDVYDNAEYNKLTAFTDEEKKHLEERIRARKDGAPGVECIIRGMNDDGDYFRLTPEEAVRQLFTKRLIEKYGYNKEQIGFEVPVVIAGKEKLLDNKRIDIAVFQDGKKKRYRMIIEIKRPAIDDENKRYEAESSTAKEQMNSYCAQKRAAAGVIANGGGLLKFYAFPDFDNALNIQEFPYQNEKIEEWKSKQRFTLKQLMQNDRLDKELLRDVLERVNQRFCANENPETAFDEIFKLIFTKLYDEWLSRRDADRIADRVSDGQLLSGIDDAHFRAMEFRASGESKEIKQRLEKLFQEAQNKWRGIFTIIDAKGAVANSTFNMSSGTIKKCVEELQDVKLFNSNLEVVDDAFEHLVNPNQKSEMGQFFTPRYVIDMCVKMTNPSENDKIIDTAAGSCGFPMHAVFHVWHKMNPDSYNFTSGERGDKELGFVQNNVFGIDLSPRSVRVGRMLNIIAGDGHTNVLELNSLDYNSWDAKLLDTEWRSKNEEGFNKLKALARDKTYKYFDFDVLMANPPFAGDRDKGEEEDGTLVLENYDLAHKGKDIKSKVGRDVLFIERNLNFLKPGGRMAIVLPQGRFNNSSDKEIRDYIASKARILAVVGLHGNVFKSPKNGTGTKTSVLLVQKWTDENSPDGNICPKTYTSVKDADGNEKQVLDYNVFFATMQEPSKDNSGQKIYVTEDYVSWTTYSYENARVITRKADGAVVTQEEYDGADKKSAYKVEVQKQVTADEHKNKYKSGFLKDVKDTVFIKDLFIADYGAIESHRKWVQRNITFTLKGRKDEKHPRDITIADYLKLDSNSQKLYKEVLTEGKNTGPAMVRYAASGYSPTITNEEYNALSAAEKKLYDKAEWVNEWSERVKDTHGHNFVKHDLFNHDSALNAQAAATDPRLKDRYCKDGIAEAFIAFAKAEGLSFFR